MSIDPGGPVARYLALGDRCHRAGLFAQAEVLYRIAAEHRPDDDAVLHLIGLTAYAAGEHARSLRLIERAIRIRESAEYHSNRGLALQSLGRLDEAIEAFRTSIRLDPAIAESHYNLGTVLDDVGRCDEAAAAYQSALMLRPTYANAHFNLGQTLSRLGRMDEAEAAYRAAVDLMPALADARTNLGNLLMRRGLVAQAAASYQAAVDVAPDDPRAHWNLSLALLMSGDFERGWEEYDWRLRGGDPASARRDFTQPMWAGEPLQGKTILLHAEQGLGDALHFVRYAPAVAQRGARVVLEVHRPLLRLLDGLPGVARVVARGEPLPAFDVHCPLLSLPRVFGTTLDSVPAAAPYVVPPAEAMQAWKARLGPRKGLSVGVVWAGNPKHTNDVNRSLRLAALLPLLDVPGVQAFSLQKDLRPGDSDALAALGARMVDLGPLLDDFVDTAAVLANLDLLVTVDTSVAHLAGALGRPAWVLLPFVPDWRWMLDRPDTPWYPTMRLFRQPGPDDWDGAVGQLLHALTHAAAARDRF